MGSPEKKYSEGQVFVTLISEAVMEFVILELGLKVLSRSNKMNTLVLEVPVGQESFWMHKLEQRGFVASASRVEIE